MFEEQEHTVEQWLGDQSTFIAFQSYVTLIAPEVDHRAINYSDWLQYVAHNANVISVIKQWIRDTASFEL
jgi:hypothetical protein